MLDILLVDSHPGSLIALDEAMTAEGYRVVTALDGLSAQAALATSVFDVIVCEVSLPNVGGLALFHRVREQSPATRFILMTAVPNVAEAVSALKAGAADYLTKPFHFEELHPTLSQIARAHELSSQLAARRREPAEDGARGGMIGRSPPMMRLFDRVQKLAASDSPVLISGESGSGKELVARELHAASPRRRGPFVAVNCASFPETLLEAELFGHERGAFTGAVQKRDGRFKAAEGGTLLLDEVAELPLAAQSKLLRVLQDGTYEPLGTNRTERASVRVISATHRKLKELVERRLCREDLYYRLNTLTIEVPPLRDRGGDRFLLLDRLLRKVAAPSPPPSITARALAALAGYPFPGNVRELSHAVEQAVALSEDGQIDLPHLPLEVGGSDGAAPQSAASASLPLAVREFERELVRRTLHEHNGSRTRAADLLGISRKTLWEKLRGYGFVEADLAPAKSA